jgi:hypothetical protein
MSFDWRKSVFIVTQDSYSSDSDPACLPSDQSFNITSRSFDEPEVLQGNSIQEETSLPNISTSSFTVTYSIIPEGTEKGKEKLVQSKFKKCIVMHVLILSIVKHYP